MRRLVSGLLVALLILSFLIPGIQLGLSAKDVSQPIAANATTPNQPGSSVASSALINAGVQGQISAPSDPLDYGVIAKVAVNSSTYDPTRPTHWITGVANNLYFNVPYGSAGWVSQSFDTNRTWGNWIRLTNISTADPHNYLVGIELKVYDYNRSQWLTPNFIYSSCGNDLTGPAGNLIDGLTFTSWTHSTIELHEVVVGFSSVIQVSRIELYVNSYDNRSFWQTVRVDIANAWQTVGPSPWLSSSDGNYIWTGSNGNTIGDFSFSQNQYVWTEDRVANAYLELNFTKTLPDTNITLDYYNLNSWSSVTYSTSTVNQWVAINATLSADWGNQTVLNNFKIRMTPQMSAVDTLKIEDAYFYWNTSTIASRIAYYLNAPSSVANWTQNYFGLLFGKVSKADMANYIDTLASNQQWLDVIRWSVRCQKLGIQETAQIEWALGNITQVGGSLPNTTKYNGEDAFSVYEREVLYGVYYYANLLNYLTNKWNVGMAYSYFTATVAKNSYPALLMVENNYNPVDGAGRFYDEGAETIDCYLIFYELKIPAALNGALNTWNWVNSNDWDSANGHYMYDPSHDYYECEGAFFTRIAAILQYFDWNAGNISRTILDVYNRFLVNEWASPQWTLSDGTLAYSVVHANPGDSERRLENTFGAWFMMLGLYTILNSTAQAKYQDMLLHAGWSKIYSPNSLLYDPTTQAFKMSSKSPSTDPSATVLAVTMQLAQGIVPITTSLAYPLEELHYEYLWDVDPLNLAMDYDNSMLNVSVSGAGTLRFIYGVSPVDYYFPQPGSYQITFANAWTTITNVTRLGDLPLNRKYIGKYQIAFVQTGATADFPGTILTVDGTNYIPAALPVSFTWDLGSNHTFAFYSPLLVSDHNKQYVWTNTTGLTTLQSGSLNVTIFGVITGIYKTQYYLTVSSPYATPGGQGWYDYNAKAYATLDTGFVYQGNGTSRVFTSWSGDASGTNFTQSDAMMMTSARTALANWKTQYNVTFTHSGLDLSASGTVATVNATPVTFSQLPYNLWVDSGGTISYAYNDVASLNTGERFILVNVSGPLSPITVTGPVTITGNYKTQYYLTNIATYGIPTPVSGWFDNGTSIDASVPTPYYFSSDTRYECTGWTGTGSVPSSGTDANVTFTITQPSQIVWKWKLQYRLGVFINPSTLNPTPNMNPLGENDTAQGYYWYEGNTIVTLTAQPVLGYTFDKWNVDGSLYGAGVNAISVVMDGPHIATAFYTARDVAVSNVTSSKTVVDQGYPMNITVTVANLGLISETFNVTVYANSTVLMNQTVTLQNMRSTTIIVTLNSSSFAYGKLNIWAYASPVLGEVNTTNNTYNDGNVTVTILGDVDGDFKVKLADLVTLANAYNSHPGSPKWNPNADLNGDGVVNLLDLVIMAGHYGQHYP